ncbi:hypothetical protein G6M50_33260 [Agrobacterium rhizogenes]|jgi:hypothetical protein|uniref:Uncharacterized protein n=2 Tax=unclassified Rhizobium TaxID=2613769 RepID=A0AAU7SB80_9HYPH|nr:hypothetical protein [Rhizobium rhizogenes]NTJ82664.1 hypothetical protein [Rhizobium rhizogenes]
MKLPFERTPRNALTVSAKRTQKRRFFAREAEIIADDGSGSGPEPAAPTRLAAKRPERRLYAWRKLTARIRNLIALTTLAREIPAVQPEKTWVSGSFGTSAAGLPTQTTCLKLERPIHGACKLIVKS